MVKYEYDHNQSSRQPMINNAPFRDACDEWLVVTCLVPKINTGVVEFQEHDVVEVLCRALHSTRVQVRSGDQNKVGSSLGGTMVFVDILGICELAVHMTEQ